VKKKGSVLKKVVVGSMMANCYIYGDANTKEVFIIDPGGDYEKIMALVEKNAFKVKAIINTHGHIDHISANRYFKFPIWIHKEDAPCLGDPTKNLSSLVGFRLRSPEAARELEGGDKLTVGGVTLEVIHTPGHTLGSICLKGDGILFTGDLLFLDGVGRTDFPYGSQEDLYDSLKKKILTLDDDIVVYPGHGPTTTIGNEKKTNGFTE
jgi:glyoxylase-like metal-dependent hydrolase (beta-lactamase superfamily II)